MSSEKNIVCGIIESWEHFKKCAEGKAFAFKFLKGRNPIGDGYYNKVVCFPGLNVDVPFTTETHSENEYVTGIWEPYVCDGPHYKEGRLVEFELGADTFLNKLYKKAILFKSQL